MALRVLDGNQSATTLSSVVTGGEHIVAHTVVSLGSIAIANITSAVSGSVVTIPDLARLGNSIASDATADANLDFIKIGGHQDGQNQVAHIVHVSAGGAMKVDASGSSVTFTQAPVTFGAITGSASILNFPSTQTIAGTVTANFTNSVTVGAIIGPAGGSCLQAISGSGDAVRIVFQGRDSAGNYSPIVGSGVNQYNIPIYGTVTIGNSVTIGSLPAISGTVTANVPLNTDSYAALAGIRVIGAGLDGGLRVQGIDPSTYGPQNFEEGGALPVMTQLGFPLEISGTVTANNPNGALTTRFGSVVTANLAQITSAVTNTSRKYLLAQNISAGTVTIGIGFSPTTTQGIQLTAGGGLTFDAFCPTGAVYWLGAVTGAAYTILEG